MAGCVGGACIAGCIHSWGHVWWWHAWWGACMVGGVRGRRDGHCTGRYASRWNAVLFILFPFPDQVLSFMLKRCLKLLESYD